MIDQKLWGYHGDITLGFRKFPWKIWTARIPIRWHHAGSCRPGPFQDTSPPGTAHVSRNAVYLYIAFPAKTDHARVCVKIFGKTKNPMVRKTPFSKRPLWARSSEKKSDPHPVSWSCFNLLDLLSIFCNGKHRSFFETFRELPNEWPEVWP